MFVFLVCSERSGSNFVTSLVGGFPGVSAPPPTHLFRLFANNRDNYGDLAHDENWRTLVADVAAAFAAKLGAWQTTVDEAELLARSTRRSPFELLRIIYGKEAAVDGAHVSFVKENHTQSFAGTLVEAFPDCRFLMMVRDPRDVASSWVRTDSIPGGVEKAVEVWLRDQREAVPVVATLRDAGRAHFLRYEDLLAEPGRELLGIAEFLGIPFDESVFEFYRHPRTRTNADRIQAWRNTQRPIMRDNSGSFRKVLSSADVRYVELCCGDLMREFGYALETTAAPGDEAEIERLRPQLSPGRYVIDDEQEVVIRRRRIEVIERVLARRLT